MLQNRTNSFHSVLSVVSAWGALLCFAAPAQGQAEAWRQLDGPCEFVDPNIVGVDPFVAGEATLLGFDLDPLGVPVSTSVAGVGGLFFSGSLVTTFHSVGIELGADDFAVSQPSNPAGLGLHSVPNALASNGTGLPLGTTSIRFVQPGTATPGVVPAAGVWVADGPTNDVTASFYDSNDQLIVALTAPPAQGSWFVGIEDPDGIARIEIATSRQDDYYVDDLYFGPVTPVPAVETVRYGLPANPEAFDPGLTTGPVLGYTWDPIVDHTIFAPAAVADVLAVSAIGPLNVPTSFGTLLIAPPFLGGVTVNPAPGSPFSVPIPLNCSLVGMSVWTQAGSVSPGTGGIVIELTNALDLVLGNR